MKYLILLISVTILNCGIKNRTEAPKPEEKSLNVKSVDSYSLTTGIFEKDLVFLWKDGFTPDDVETMLRIQKTKEVLDDKFLELMIVYQPQKLKDYLNELQTQEDNLNKTKPAGYESQIGEIKEKKKGVLEKLNAFEEQKDLLLQKAVELKMEMMNTVDPIDLERVNLKVDQNSSSIEFKNFKVGAIEDEEVGKELKDFTTQSLDFTEAGGILKFTILNNYRQKNVDYFEVYDLNLSRDEKSIAISYKGSVKLTIRRSDTDHVESRIGEVVLK